MVLTFFNNFIAEMETEQCFSSVKKGLVQQ